MRFIFILITAFICNFAYSQESIHVKGKGYEGYVFPKEHFVFKSIENQKERYTPSVEEIAQVEKLLKDSIHYIVQNRQNQTEYKKPPINKRTLKKYKRQYVGFLTKDGDVVVWIVFFRNKNISKEELSKDIVAIYGGGSNNWAIEVNLTQKKLFNMHINGIS